MLAATLILGASLQPDQPALAQAPAAQEITVGMLDHEPDTLDPNRDTGTSNASTAVIRQLFEPLLRFDASLVPQPAAAASYDISPDGTLYTFHLRPDGRWSDGLPVTAQQFEFSWKRILDPSLAAPYAALFVDAGIVGADDYNSGKLLSASSVGIRALDDATLQITLGQPFGALPALAALPVASPLRPDIVDADPDGWARAADRLIGNGPFVVSEWAHHDHITLVQNPTFAAHAGWPRPVLTRATLLIGSGSNADMTAFPSDRRDWLRVPDTQVNQVLNDPLLAQLAQQYTELSASWVSFNNNSEHAPLDDVNVRRALSRALDRTTLIRELGTGIGVPLTGILPPGMPGYQPDPGGAELGSDAAAARALLAQAGYPNGQGFPTLTLLFATTGPGQRNAQALHAEWQQKLGIDIQLNGADNDTYQQAIDSRDYDLAFGGWAGDYPDPQDWFGTLFGCQGRNNTSGFCSPSFDRLVARADTGSALTDRLVLYQQAQAILVQDAPVAPLFARGHLVLVKPWVQAVNGGPLPVTTLDDYPGSLLLDRVQILPH